MKNNIEEQLELWDPYFPIVYVKPLRRKVFQMNSIDLLTNLYLYGKWSKSGASLFLQEQKNR